MNAKNARLSNAYSIVMSRGDRKRLAAIRRMKTPVIPSGAYLQLRYIVRNRGDEIKNPDHYTERCDDINDEYERRSESDICDNADKILLPLKRPCKPSHIHHTLSSPIVV
jgi:hypothetical protein